MGGENRVQLTNEGAVASVSLLSPCSYAEMAEDFRSAGMRVILDFGCTKYLPIDEAREIHDYGFATQEAHSDVIIGNWVHFQPERGAPALAEFRRCLASVV
jgi:hypothetical protein